MLHIIDKQSDTIVDFYSNHKKLFWDDIHFSSLNNYEEYFNFKTLYNNSEHLTSRNRVVIPNDDGYYREFIVDETLKNKQEKEVYTTASFADDLKKEKTIEPKTYDGVTVNAFLDDLLDGTGWQRGKTDYLGIATIDVENVTHPFSVLKKGATAFEGELDFRIETKGNKIVARYVDLIEQQGSWNGKEITIGKDLIGVTRRENAENIVTALLCYGPEQEDGSRLVVEVKDDDARKRWGRPKSNPQHLWAVYEPQSTDQEMTEAQLRSLGETELEKRINAVVEYECDQVSIEHIFGFSHEKVRKGDTVRIKDTSYSPALYLEARVRDVERSITNPSQKKYVLGDFVEYDEEDVMALFRSMQQVLSQKVSEQEMLDRTYTKVEINDKDSTVESNAAADATQKADQAQTNAEQHADSVSNQAEQNANDYTDQRETQIMSEVNDKADEAYVNAELALRELSIHRGTAPPSNTDQMWIDMNTLPNVMKRYDDASSSWVKMTPTEAEEVGTYSSSDIDTALDSKASVTEFNALDGRLDSAETSITQNENEIATKASQTELNMLTGRVDDAETSITQNANEIATKAEQTTVDNLEGRVSTAESNITQNANEISSKVEASYVDNAINDKIYRYDNNQYDSTDDASQYSPKPSVAVMQTTTGSWPGSQYGTLTTYWSENQRGNQRYVDSNGNIFEREVHPSVYPTWSDWRRIEDVDGAQNKVDNAVGPIDSRLSTAESEITQNADAIQQRVTTSEFNNLEGRVETAESTITQHSDQIALKVDEDGVIGAINLSSETATIDADKINLVGAVTVLSDITGNLGSITAGDINGVNINGSTFTQDSTDGTITLDNNGFELLDKTYDEKIFIGITNNGGNHGGNYGLYFQNPDGSFNGGLSYYYTDLILEGKSNVSIIGGDLGVWVDGTSSAVDFGTHIDGGLRVDGNGVLVRSSGRSLILRSLSDGNFAATYVDFQNTNGDRLGYFGFGSPNDNVFYISNDTAGAVEIRADLHVNEDFTVSGSKSAIVDTVNYGTRKMYAVESPDNRFVAYTEHVLEEGEHEIIIEPMFLETISQYFVVPHIQNGADVTIIERLEDRFRVSVSKHKAEVVFEVNGLRKGYEGVYMEQVENNEEEVA